MHPKLMELSLLKDNWDSYGGKPMAELALAEANHFINAFKAIGAVDPFICPCSNGGVQLEWHRNGYDLEMEILPDGSMGEVFCEKSSS